MEGLAGLADAMDGVMAQIRQKFKDASKQEGALESFRAFLAAVDWTVRFLQERSSKPATSAPVYLLEGWQNRSEISIHSGR
jgi:hypothetical protein